LVLFAIQSNPTPVSADDDHLQHCSLFFIIIER
jgi:hypothetical protein